MEPSFMRTFVSVDCIVFGFEKNKLNVLLVQRNTPDSTGEGLKLPGSLIYQEEDADEAAHRVLNELTGIKRMQLRQFKSFTSPQRTASKEDVAWLEVAYGIKIDRLITISYLSLCKISRKMNPVSKYSTVQWCPIDQLPKMPFDHNQIVEESLLEIQEWVRNEPAILFELLPAKFTASQLRGLYEAVYHKQYDVRNFHKKMVGMDYLVPLDEKQANVSHRAARYYKFDRVKYNKRKASI